MKPSRYNVFIELPNGGMLAFNGRTIALAEVDPESRPKVEKLLEDSESAKTGEERQLHDQMVMAKYLVENDSDEVAELRVDNRLQRYGNKTFTLTIAPTLACNFACDYCFESQKKGKMTPAIEKALLKFVEARLKRSERMQVAWFGGEPTLCMDMIERLHKEFKLLCDKYEVELLPGSIITNGYLLDGDMAGRLKDLNITSVQITLDGPKRIHDSRRKLHNGGGTFDRIMENLTQTADILKFSIRVNIDRSNLEAADEIVDILTERGLDKKVAVYFAQVTASGEACADVRDRCLSTPEFAAHQLQLYEHLVERGFYQIQYPRVASGGYCGADTENCYVVAPSGYLFRCWEELSVNVEKSVGSIFSEAPEPFQDKNRHRYQSWDPFAKSDCSECLVLPVCMGGCPYHGMSTGSESQTACCVWKYNLDEMLKLRYVCDQRKERTE